MPTLLQLNVASNFGSTGRIAENIGILAQQQGWDCYIAHSPRYANPTQLKDICTETSWGEKIHALKSFIWDEHGLGSKHATLKLIDKIKSISPDIIHLHNIHGYYLNYPILFDFLSTIHTPIVWTLHDCWCITGHCVYFDFAHCEKWMTHCEKCPQLRTYPISFFRDNSYNNFELKKKAFLQVQKRLHLVPVSNWLGQFIAKSFLKDCSITQIYNGIDINTFAPTDNKQKDYLKANKFRILGVANKWDRRKGFADFMQLRKLLSADYEIIMVGLSKKQIEQLPDGIVGIERTDGISELAELYSMADVFFNPTWEDNFPTTNLESLACGTPVITYRTGGSPEAISEDTGFVVEQGDFSNVLSAIETIQTNKKIFYQSKCRERAVAHYDKNISYQKYIDLYNQILMK